jgi:hypothetical protein
MITKAGKNAACSAKCPEKLLVNVLDTSVVLNTKHIKKYFFSHIIMG